MMKRCLKLMVRVLVMVTCLQALTLPAVEQEHPLLVWVKQHPRPVIKGKPSPRLGYEGSYDYDPASKLLVRYGGHNQGGGGEQNSEVWTYDLDRDVWTLRQPNDAPPGVCCAQQNVFHDALGRFIRFPAFSASHGWQSLREVWLKNSSVWTFDVAANRWRDMRPVPAPPIRPLRGAAYDPHHQVVVIHGGEGARHGTVVYDLYTNTWHEMNSRGGPSQSISQPGFTYDPINRVFVLFGSQFQSNSRTWLYDLANNRWRVLATKTHPPAEKSSPVLAADSRNGIVLANVKGAEGLETWSLDVAKKEWKRLDVRYQPDTKYEGSAGNRNRVLLYLPDRNLFVLENRVRREQQIWTFRYAETPAPPPTPREVGVELQGDGSKAVVSWQPPADRERYRFNIYRGVGPKPWLLDWKLIAQRHEPTIFTDVALKPGTIAYYRVHLVTPDGEFPGSFIARTQPPIVEDVQASVVDAKRVNLTWTAAVRKDVVGYHVERAEVSVYSTDQLKRIKERLRTTSDMAVGRIRQIGVFRRLTREPIPMTNFVDTSVDLTAATKEIASPVVDDTVRADQLDPDGKPYRFAVYAYRVRAVARGGIQSGPSPVGFTFPSAVQSVFAREEGDDTTHLKWQSHHDQSVKGYHVYRQNGRFRNSAIVRLTPTPTEKTAYRDATAGRSTRRYEIVAVDAVGQEGAPSQPVWSRREWQRFYVPYVGEWHQ